MNKQIVLVTDYVFADFDQECKILAAVGAELKVSQCKSIAELNGKYPKHRAPHFVPLKCLGTRWIAPMKALLRELHALPPVRNRRDLLYAPDSPRA